jgi:hypothetical protein
MRLELTIALLLLNACAAGQQADPASDAPESRSAGAAAVIDAPSYGEALQRWRSVDDVNAWIGARFEYDMQRALRLSETQRERSGRLPIHAPQAFFAAPRGVCVDLSRFAVETLRSIEPTLKARYLMIEFDPVTIQGNTLRRHWVAHFERDGQHYFFADSKRPGHLAGPYADTAAFIHDYAAYRGREIVAFRDLESTARQMRTLAAKQRREERP